MTGPVFSSSASHWSNLHQGRTTWSGCKSALSHSSLSSQGDGRSFRRSPCSSLYKPSDWVPIISKASLVEKYCTVVIFEEEVNIIEGISGGDNFTDGNKQDCNHTEDPGVEVQKKLHCWQGQTHSSCGPGLRRPRSTPKGPSNQLSLRRTEQSKRGLAII